ncbi:MAG: transcription elongation factor GreA [Deltaproteobacteria bacterium]|nr:MAG: transcription elongation factor GreA [Deltaproteobacteria bacterium]
MSDNPVPMTPEGHKKLQEELKYLKAVERPKIVDAIEVARGHGDLSENAEYDAAKEKQGQLMGKIAFIEDQLARAQIIDPSTIVQDKIVFGASVKMVDVDSGEELSYQIVGAYESDIKLGKISIESPIAKSLIGKEIGDVVKVVTPGRSRELEIIKIHYGH